MIRTVGELKAHIEDWPDDVTLDICDVGYDRNYEYFLEDAGADGSFWLIPR